MGLRALAVVGVFFCTDEKTGMVCLVVVTCYKSPNPYIAVGVAKYIFSDGPKIYGNKPVVHVCVVAAYLVVLPQWDVQH